MIRSAGRSSSSCSRSTPTWRRWSGSRSRSRTPTPPSSVRASTSSSPGRMAGDCDLVVKGNQRGRSRGWLLGADGGFVTDFAGEPEADGRRPAGAGGGGRAAYLHLRAARARASASASIATTTARPTPPSVDEGTDPLDPASRPPSAPYVRVVTRTLRLRRRERAAGPAVAPAGELQGRVAPARSDREPDRAAGAWRLG